MWTFGKSVVIAKHMAVGKFIHLKVELMSIGNHIHQHFTSHYDGITITIDLKETDEMGRI